MLRSLCFTSVKLNKLVFKCKFYSKFISFNIITKLNVTVRVTDDPIDRRSNM
jgi:hypothetical protein